LLAVKPAQIKSVCAQLKPLIEEEPLIISIAAGVNSLKIKQYLGGYSGHKFVRAMPNLCAKKAMAITGLFGDSDWYGKKGGTVYGQRVNKIFTPIGQVFWVEQESDLDSVTAISGSGPAYIYYIMNAMIDAAEEIGLKRSDAQRLVAQTIIGAGETGKDIDNLESEIIKVSSKGGTTEKAISIFKQKKLDTIIKQAVKAAHKRSKELSK
jgi:pyrroline-5-carboxylate reductase